MESLTNRQQELVEKNHNLIYSFAKNKNLNIDSCYDILAIGLCQAAKIFDESKGKFSTIAYQCMQNEIMGDWRYNHRNRNIPDNMILSYDTSRASENFIENGSYVDVFVDNRNIDDDLNAKMLKDAFLNLLNEKDNKYLSLLFKE